jgi:hypothetical protein
VIPSDHKPGTGAISPVEQALANAAQARNQTTDTETPVVFLRARNNKRRRGFTIHCRAE